MITEDIIKLITNNVIKDMLKHKNINNEMYEEIVSKEIKDFVKNPINYNNKNV